MTTQIFLNLAVKDLNKSKEFFTALGYSFNPQFTDDNGACLVIGENIYAMLLTEKFFQGFTKKKIADATKEAEVINALGVESREEVDRIVDAALAAGGKIARDAEDHGWMYIRSFEDLDGHIWEVAHMDLSKFPTA